MTRYDNIEKGYIGGSTVVMENDSSYCYPPSLPHALRLRLADVPSHNRSLDLQVEGLAWDCGLGTRPGDVRGRGSVCATEREGAAVTTLHELYAELDTFAALPENWNTYGAGPIAEETIVEAKVILARLYSLLPLDGDIGLSPTGDGGIVIQGWHNGYTIEIVIEPQKERP